MAARQMAILETVTRDGEASVTALAEALSVSQVTIRKDLDTLEEQGLVRRERGIATPVSSDDPAGRIAHHYAAKLRIAQAAAGSVSEGETVMIEAGSCCSLLAEEIARTKRYGRKAVIMPISRLNLCIHSIKQSAPSLAAVTNLS